jgi:hypothetical protein
MASTLQNTLDFLKDFGFFDVVVPFLLFFAIIFAFLEKTSILGSKKSNVNLIVALSVSLLVVAANKAVNFISTVIPNMVLVLVLLVFFVMITGVFFKDGDKDFYNAHKGWFAVFMVILFILTIGFVLNAWPVEGDKTLLVQMWDAIASGSSGEVVGGFILLVFIIGAIVLVMKSSQKNPDEDD